MSQHRGTDMITDDPDTNSRQAESPLSAPKYKTLQEAVAEILFKEHTDGCDNGCGWRYEDELESEATNELIALFKAHLARAVTAARIEGKLEAANNLLEMDGLKVPSALVNMKYQLEAQLGRRKNARSGHD